MRLKRLELLRLTALVPKTSVATNYTTVTITATENWTPIYWLKTSCPNHWTTAAYERKTRLELATNSLEDCASTNWVTFAYVRKVGFEPTLFTLRERIYSPPLHHRRSLLRLWALDRNWTCNLLITSELLCQLSYKSISPFTINIPVRVYWCIILNNFTVNKVVHSPNRLTLYFRWVHLPKIGLEPIRCFHQRILLTTIAFATKA